mmetsp:Transcript_16159/g.39919  ORF Transcript_16159/g.39919 Transcript_16159/m.39919 type:complete len:361 (+) Transcript_16159:2025-3107(+)
MAVMPSGVASSFARRLLPSMSAFGPSGDGANPYTGRAIEIRPCRLCSSAISLSKFCGPSPRVSRGAGGCWAPASAAPAFAPPPMLVIRPLGAKLKLDLRDFREGASSGVEKVLYASPICFPMPFIAASSTSITPAARCASLAPAPYVTSHTCQPSAVLIFSVAPVLPAPASTAFFRASASAGASGCAAASPAAAWVNTIASPCETAFTGFTSDSTSCTAFAVGGPRIGEITSTFSRPERGTTRASLHPSCSFSLLRISSSVWLWRSGQSFRLARYRSTARPREIAPAGCASDGQAPFNAASIAAMSNLPAGSTAVKASLLGFPSASMAIPALMSMQLVAAFSFSFTASSSWSFRFRGRST